MPYKEITDKQKYQREYKIKNRERLNKWRVEWRKKNIVREKKRETDYAKTYRIRRPDKFRVWDRKQKVKQRARFKIGLRQLRIDCGGRCSRCGYSDNIDILHFHHNTGEKSIEVTRCKTVRKAIEESSKCILLCPNCHAIEHLT